MKTVKQERIVTGYGGSIQVGSIVLPVIKWSMALVEDTPVVEGSLQPKEQQPMIKQGKEQ